MDTRRPINETTEPAVLSVAFNQDSTRFICGLDNGIRAFQSRDCIRTLKEAPGAGAGIAIAECLDDRYLAIVGGGRHPTSSLNKVEFWDNVEAKKVTELDLSEPILGIRMTAKYFTVILEDRTVCFEYGIVKESGLCGPAFVRGLYNTARNPYALCCISGDTMILPGLTPGQVQIIKPSDKTKKIIRAHNSSLSQLDLSRDGELIATAGEKGTLIRVFSTTHLHQTHEFRRGVDAAQTYSLRFSPLASFLASTSDKGTLHIFSLLPNPSQEPSSPRPRQRDSLPGLRIRPQSMDIDASSNPSGHSSSPSRAAISNASGAFYLPPPDLAHQPPTTAPSALSALAKLPGMPRAFSDMRSMTSTPYSLGSDPPNWQGQPSHTTTTLPNGQKKRVRNDNVVLPGRPDGRPPKGVVGWGPEGGERRLWVLGGGADARWEVFELVDGERGGLRVVKVGWRGFLSRQFAAEEV